MAYFVALDSGGTKTECWLGDETQVLGRAVCGTVKLTRVGQEVATERLQRLLAEVSEQSRVALHDVTNTCVGIAGYTITEVREWAARVVGALVGGNVEVCGDEEIALDAAFRGGPGILVIGGTGSAVVGRCVDGTEFRAGGWGPGIGDEGSGYWIGKEALREAFRAMDMAHDGTTGTGLVDAIRVAWGLKDVGEIVAFANSRPGPDFAALAPVVMRYAAGGDLVALNVLERAGVELGQQVAIVWRKMQARGETTAQVAYTGSVVEKIAVVSNRMRGWIEHSCAELHVIDGAVNAMEGAMWKARGQARPDLPTRASTAQDNQIPPETLAPTQ